MGLMALGMALWLLKSRKPNFGFNKACTHISSRTCIFFNNHPKHWSYSVLYASEKLSLSKRFWTKSAQSDCRVITKISKELNVSWIIIGPNLEHTHTIAVHTWAPCGHVWSWVISDWSEGPFFLHFKTANECFFSKVYTTMKFQLVYRKFQLVCTPITERCNWSVHNHWYEGAHICYSIIYSTSKVSAKAQ